MGRLHQSIPGTVLLVQFQGSLIDFGPNTYTVSPVDVHTHAPNATPPFVSLSSNPGSTDQCLVGVSLDGGTTTLMISQPAALQMTGAMTVEWLMMQKPTFEWTYFCCCEPGARALSSPDRLGSLYTLYTSSGAPAISDQHISGSTAPPTFGSFPGYSNSNWAGAAIPNPGNWQLHHFAYVRDGSGNWHILRDGVTTGAGVASDGANTATGLENFFIGCCEDATGAAGVFASVRILNYARADSDILADAIYTTSSCLPFTGNTSPNGFLVIPSADQVCVGGMNRLATVATVPTANTFTYKTLDADYFGSYVVSETGVTATPAKAQPAPAGVPGPFSYDLVSGLAITKTQQTLTSVLNADRRYSSISLDNALPFPDAVGYLVFDFGYQNQVGPVKYLGRLSETQLLLDASFKFPNSILSGTTVILLSSKAPFVPPDDQLVGNLYLTGSASGRAAALDTLDQVTAAGLDLDVQVVYPGDRGLANEGFPDRGDYKVSGAVEVFGGDDLDTEIADAEAGDE